MELDLHLLNGCSRELKAASEVILIGYVNPTSLSRRDDH